MTVKLVNDKVLETKDFYLINCTSHNVQLVNAMPNSLEKRPDDTKIITLSPFSILDVEVEKSSVSKNSFTLIKELPIIGKDQFLDFIKNTILYFNDLSISNKDLFVLISFKALSGIYNRFKTCHFTNTFLYKETGLMAPYKTVYFVSPVMATIRSIKPPVACLYYYSTLNIYI